MSQKQSTATGQAPSGHPQKAPRLRAACNQCYVAKVKCTGEREGCTRCKTLRAECIYAESRVGKVPGIRAKNKKIEQQRRRQQREEEEEDEDDGRGGERGAASEQYVDGDTADVIVASQNPLAHPSKRRATESSQQPMGTWSENWPSSTAWLDVPMLDNVLLNFDNTIGETGLQPRGAGDNQDFDVDVDVDPAEYDQASIGNSPQRMPTPSTSSSGWPHSSHSRTSPGVGALPPKPTNIATDIARGYPTPRPSSRPTRTPQAGSDTGRKTEFEPVLAERGRNFAKVDSECVMVCTHIIAVLENYLLCEPKTFYLILEPTRKAATELKNLVHLQQQSRCERCISLFTVILSQMIELLEAGIRTPPDSEAGIPNGGFLSSMQSNLGFSAFSLTADEQRGWQSRIIRKEYHNVTEIVSSVIELARLGPRGVASTPAMAEERIRALARLRQRFNQFAEREKETGVEMM
ncbi:uncharacterized protein GGS22DRAFT_114006 [Annulohypoxylon maeteangense]|uniref:uncharacterized protein n=1 Tax=Annulohypoxylon maeteangense TaxID=1927788 RepID=UPI0020072688|nr:uncharacterized protein GGS22DRAFT_114006 [Annulohypoxylon maeteangense]KAI0886472.1 hypothetical protein GGS22DRAFT_114006 [Annulohypoxylon maeteangense]